MSKNANGRASLDYLARKHAEATGTTIINAKKEIKEVLQTISSVLQEKDELSIKNYFTFKVRISPARLGRNPVTGEKISIPEKKVLRISVSSSLKNLLNG